MDLVEVCSKFPTQAACIAHLEDARWGDEPICPFCGSDRVARKRENQRVGRWNCHSCHNSYNVLTGTIFKGTKVPLQKWFLSIEILLNARKRVSSLQLADDLDLTPPTAWRMGRRIRKVMADDSVFLSGIVEADEASVTTAGSMKKEDEDPPRSGRRTK